MTVDSLVEKGVGALNEDHCCIRGNLFGVFDGATSLTPATYGNGRTGGYMAATIAGQAFARNDASLPCLAERANNAIRESMVRHGVDLDDRGGLWCASGAVLRVHGDWFEWVQIGDCVICAMFEDGGFELLQSGFDHDAETLELWKRVSCETDAPVHAAVAEKILEVRTRMNVTYGVFNGEEQAMSFLRSGRRPIGDIKHLVLCTDGLFIPTQDPAGKEDFSEFARVFMDGGLTGLRDQVRAVEETDRQCRLYPRFKAHDDIAAISISF